MPESLDARYSLEHDVRRGGAALDDVALAAFFAAAFADLEGPDSVRMTDTHYAVRWAVDDRESARFTAAALFARRKADQLVKSIAALPFPTGARASADTWRAAATELGATLVPTGPALWRVPFVKRLQTGEERTFTASIATRWNGDDPATEVAIDLSQAAVPENARAALEHDHASPYLRAVRSSFSRVCIDPNGGAATFGRPGLTHDPREVIGALDSFVTWAIEARGERIAHPAYR